MADGCASPRGQVAIPTLYLSLLFAARHALLLQRPTPLSRALAFLADDFEPVFFWCAIDIPPLHPPPPSRGNPAYW